MTGSPVRKPDNRASPLLLSAMPSSGGPAPPQYTPGRSSGDIFDHVEAGAYDRQPSTETGQPGFASTALSDAEIGRTRTATIHSRPIQRRYFRSRRSGSL